MNFLYLTSQMCLQNIFECAFEEKFGETAHLLKKALLTLEYGDYKGPALIVHVD